MSKKNIEGGNGASTYISSKKAVLMHGDTELALDIFSRILFLVAALQ